MTELTDRERALVETARELHRVYNFAGERPATQGFLAALRAYDPPKPKVYVLPTWEEFVRAFAFQQRDYQESYSQEWVAAVVYEEGKSAKISRNQYNAIRELTAKEQE